MFEPWMLGMIDEAGYNGIRDEHIEIVVRELERLGVQDVDRRTFERAVLACGIMPGNFDDEAIERLQKALNSKY